MCHRHPSRNRRWAVAPVPSASSKVPARVLGSLRPMNTSARLGGAGACSAGWIVGDWVGAQPMAKTASSTV